MKMPRIHGVELEDLSVCPAWLRDEATEILVFGLNLAGWPKAIARTWLPWLKELHFPRVIDCCSGSSGPIGGILQEHPLRVTVTDLLAAGTPVIAPTCYSERPGDTKVYDDAARAGRRILPVQ